MNSILKEVTNPFYDIDMETVKRRGEISLHRPLQHESSLCIDVQN